MNVYKVNDCDWVAAQSFDEAKAWYLNEYGVDDDECWLEEECSLEQTMLIDISDLSYEELENATDTENGKIRRSFAWVMEHIHKHQQTPYHIASTEY